MQLSALYITALFEIYTALSAGKDFTEQRFQRVVNSADLSCPLDQDILKKAYAELTRRKTDRTRYKALAATA